MKLTKTLAPLALLLMSLSCHEATETPSGIDLAPFKAMAASAECDDVRNRLFLIDDSSVFWDREGSCADMRFTFSLFGNTPSDVRCNRGDSIGGANVTLCTDESFRPMFETITANLDDPNLGLGAGHVVVPVPF